MPQNDQVVRVWAPTGSNGYCIFVGDGWGPDAEHIKERTCDVRIQIFLPDATPDWGQNWTVVGGSKKCVVRNAFHDLTPSTEL